MSRRHLTLLTLLVAMFWFVGCQQSAPLERSSSASKEPGSSDLKKVPKVEEEEEEADPKKKKKPSSKKDDDDDEDDDEDDDDKDKDKEEAEEDETPV